MVQECESLKTKQQLQKETAVASLNQIQRQSQEKSTELHSKIQELSGQVKEVSKWSKLCFNSLPLKTLVKLMSP